uniref:Uncharacterized protein n=1 Tax=Helianthus annuus TaxID=4232 RepID=A0A251SFK6_HELAN
MSTPPNEIIAILPPTVHCYVATLPPVNRFCQVNFIPNPDQFILHHHHQQFNRLIVVCFFIIIFKRFCQISNELLLMMNLCASFL